MAIRPRPPFRDLFAQALTGTSDVLLVSPEEAEARLLEEAGANLGAGGDGGGSIPKISTLQSCLVLSGAPLLHPDEADDGRRQQHHADHGDNEDVLGRAVHQQ